MPAYQILVPTDFSACSHAALRHAISLARVHSPAQLTLMYVDPGVVPPYEDQLGVLEPNRLIAMMKLRVAEVAVDADIPIDELVVSGEPRTKITEVAVERGADLIVMGTHGRAGLDRILVGSVAESVLRNAPCPVMVVKDQRQAAVDSQDGDQSTVDTAESPGA